MRTVPKNIEALVVRRLDGAIAEDDGLALDRELIRNPQARRLQEEYSRIDELASSALNRALTGAAPFDVEALPEQVSVPARPSSRTPWLVPGAIAAALLAVVLSRFPFERNRQVQTPIAAGTHDTPTQVVPRIGPEYGPGEMRYNASLGRPSIKRDTGREVIGVMGEDGNLYWIEVDRTRTVRRPGDVRL